MYVKINNFLYREDVFRNRNAAVIGIAARKTTSDVFDMRNGIKQR